MRKNPLVSVIIPVYNQESYVNKCLKSIVNQTYYNLQIIVVNDGSTDNSMEIVNKFKERDDRITVVSKENEGLAFARRDGLSIAEGEYIVFVDSDDYLLFSAIQDLVELSEMYQVDSVIGNYYRKYGPFFKKAHFEPTLPVNEVIRGNNLMDKYYISFFGQNILPVNVCIRIYRKSVIDEAMQSECLYSKYCRQMGEDEYFNVMLFPYINSLYVTDKMIYVYRWGGMTSRYNKNLSGLFDFSDIRIKLLDKYNYKKGYNFLFIEYKNILYSELLQRIQYLRQDKDTLIEYIRTELNNRYIVKRMKEYYNGNCPDYMRPLIEDDYESIYLRAVDMSKANRWRFVLKEVLSHVSNILKIFN